MNFATVILAGGEGSRIGGGKPLRVLAGKTLLERAISQARGWSDQMAVAVRDPAQIQGAAVTTIEDSPDIEGPLGGLSAALHHAHDKGLDAVLTIPADMPFLPSDLAARFSNAIEGRCAAVAASAGRLHPVCGLWRVAALDLLPDYLASGRRSLGDFARAVGMLSVSWEARPHDPFFNINGPEDLAAAERLVRNQKSSTSTS
jgi:molybdenum cofactor guanylyltransferase